MPLKTPSFWYRKAGHPAPALEWLLRPFSALYACAHFVNQALRRPDKAALPVLCVGNVVAGGSGKTPAAIAIHGILRRHGLAEAPWFLTRGYGGRLSGPVVLGGDHTPAEAGDESLLLLRRGATVLAHDRKAGAALAARSGASLVIMDDGLQNRSIRKDISFMVIDGAAGFGNARLLPAGPLRERLESAFARTDAFIIVGKDLRDTALSLPPEKPLFTAHVRGIVPEALDPAAPVVAFAGLGRPEKFYHLLQHMGAHIAGWHGFADHHVYTQAELQALAREAKEKDAALLTTEKDMVRLAGFTPDVPFHALPIELVFDDEKALVDFLRFRLTLAA